MVAMQESFDNKQIAQRHFESAFKDVEATGHVTVEMQRMYDRFRRPGGGGLAKTM